MCLHELSWPAVAAVSREVPVVVPIAAVEQHGRHLPIFTDSMLLEEVVRSAAPRLEDRIVWAPLLWLGNSHHHLDFAGTLSAAPRTYLDLLGDLIGNLGGHGFRRIVLLNGHGGNIVPASQAVFEARQRYRGRDDLLLLAATYWLPGSRPRDENSAFVQDRMGHACEWETSMILKLAPHLVGDLGPRARPLRQPLRTGHTRLYHPGTQHPRTHRRPPPGQRREGRDPLPPFCRRCHRVSRAGDRLERALLGWVR